jgi:hypothetical protein
MNHLLGVAMVGKACRRPPDQPDRQVGLARRI